MKHTQRGTRGETLSETLIALLISVLATLVFSGAVTTTMNLIRAGRERLERYNAANAALELRVTPAGEEPLEGTVSLGGLDADAHVRFYRNSTGYIPIIAYQEAG